MIGTTEVLLIAGIALLLFGGKKLPELMRGMGRGMRIFREEMNSPYRPETGNDVQDDSNRQKEMPDTTSSNSAEYRNERGQRSATTDTAQTTNAPSTTDTATGRHE